jgi:hypothetical protein
VLYHPVRVRVDDDDDDDDNVFTFFESLTRGKTQNKRRLTNIYNKQKQ